MPLLLCIPILLAGCEPVTACRRGACGSLRYAQQTISASQSSPFWPSLAWDTRSVPNLRPGGLRVFCFGKCRPSGLGTSLKGPSKNAHAGLGSRAHSRTLRAG